MSSNDRYSDDFLFAKVVEDFETIKRRKTQPHKPTEFELTDKFTETQRKSVDEQVKETAQIMENKTLREENEVFYTIYPKSLVSEPDVKDLLKGLKATLVAYIDRKNNGLLLAANAERLKNLAEKPTKYLTNGVRMIKALDPVEQIDNKLKNDQQGIQMAILTMIPNLSMDKILNYMGKMISYLHQKNCPLYGLDLQRYGFILADVTLSIAQEIAQISTFIFSITKVPDAIAHEIRTTDFKTKNDKLESLESNVSNEFLPTIVLMDSGVNIVPSIKNVLKSRDAYQFLNLDDEHDYPGHGTPIAHLITHGEDNLEPTANIISYKIWSGKQRKWAYNGYLNGIEKYSDQTRLFISSIGIPFLPFEQIVVLDRLVQEKNIILVVSGGNIDLPDIQEYLMSGARYPDYVRFFPVMPPANGANIISTGSLAKRVSAVHTSLARQDQISPHSRCGPGAVDLHNCRKPELVEHGGNVNIDGSLQLNTEGVGVRSVDKNGSVVDNLSGSSFSSPLLIRRLAEIERKYRSQIKNVETLLSIIYLTCRQNLDSCWGYGEPVTVVNSEPNDAIYLAEGTLGFPQSDDDTITTPFNDVVFYVPPSVNEIRLCVVHSDNFKKATIPSLETTLEIKAKKFGNTQQIQPINKSDLSRKTNVKILTYRFDSKSMESIWRFTLKPKTVNDLLSEDKKNITVRYGCSIMLKRKLDRQSKKSLTQEILENKEKYL